MSDDDLLALLREAARAAGAALEAVEDRRLATDVDGQYALDVVTDAVVVPLLVDAGVGVLSEETGLHHPDRDVVVVVDPVDGSTNASRHVPWHASSLCAVDADGPRAAVVANLATGEVFDAVRGGGARLDGRPIRPSSATELKRSLVALNGLPDQPWDWEQCRVFGAAALDLCSVAAGRVDAFVDLWPAGLGPWDYLGGVLICREAGAVVAEANGRPLVALEHGARRSVAAAATADLLAEVLAAREAGVGARRSAS